MKKGLKLFFIESICNDDAIIESNIKEVKTASPDYTNFTEDRVLDDFKKRIGHYNERNIRPWTRTLSQTTAS